MQQRYISTCITDCVQWQPFNTIYKVTPLTTISRSPTNAPLQILSERLQKYNLRDPASFLNTSDPPFIPKKNPLPQLPSQLNAPSSKISSICFHYPPQPPKPSHQTVPTVSKIRTCPTIREISPLHHPNRLSGPRCRENGRRRARIHSSAPSPPKTTGENKCRSNPTQVLPTPTEPQIQIQA